MRACAVLNFISLGMCTLSVALTNACFNLIRASISAEYPLSGQSRPPYLLIAADILQG